MIPVMSMFANELDCLRARDKWFTEKVLSLQSKICDLEDKIEDLKEALADAKGK